MCSLFFLFLSFIFEKVFSFSHFVSKNQGAKKKKKKEIKKKKEMGSGVYVYGGKKGRVEKKKEKKN
jgi:preprotein translocase subunit YajC